MMRPRAPDLSKAKNLLEAARHRFEFTKTLKVTSESSPTIVDNIYESFRMVGAARFALRGKESIEKDSHALMLQELYDLTIDTDRPIHAVDNLRHIRHRIHYNGYLATQMEANDAVNIANACFEQVLKAVVTEVTSLK